MKPYQRVAIAECGEPLVPIPLEQFSVEQPHPYVKLAAPYGDKSPYYLRQGVLVALIEAQRQLQLQRPGWQIQIFDAYRPIAVQQFMVDYTIAETVREQGLTLEQLTEVERQPILELVQQFWAIPSTDPATPPPHSTGAALDVTLVDASGRVVEMGSPIDEMSPRSHPDYFATVSGKWGAEDENNRRFHQNRQLLKQVMVAVGFGQHPQEWWHFSLGDQLWAWLRHQADPGVVPIARYGAVN